MTSKRTCATILLGCLWGTTAGCAGHLKIPSERSPLIRHEGNSVFVKDGTWYRTLGEAVGEDGRPEILRRAWSADAWWRASTIVGGVAALGALVGMGFHKFGDSEGETATVLYASALVVYLVDRIWIDPSARRNTRDAINLYNHDVMKKLGLLRPAESAGDSAGTPTVMP